MSSRIHLSTNQMPLLALAQSRSLIPPFPSKFRVLKAAQRTVGRKRAVRSWCLILIKIYLLTRSLVLILWVSYRFFPRTISRREYWWMNTSWGRATPNRFPTCTRRNLGPSSRIRATKWATRPVSSQKMQLRAVHFPIRTKRPWNQ